MTPELAGAIARAQNVLRGQGVDPVLIGGLVSELFRQKFPRLPVVRRTNDADFAIRVPDWEAYRRVRAGLIEAGFTPVANIEHRLLLEGVLVDIVPYGPELSDDAGSIVWPHSQNRMNVIGFDEACARAVEVETPGRVAIKTVTPEGMSLLKVVAFLDRLGRGDEKYKSDAEDLDFWMRNYGATRDIAPFFVLDLGLEGVTVAESDAALLGFYVGQLASDRASGEIDRFVNEHGDLYGRFVSSVVAPTADDRERQRAFARLRAFNSGAAAGRDMKPGSPRVLHVTSGDLTTDLLGVAACRDARGRIFVDAFVLVENRGAGDTIREAALLVDLDRCEASPQHPWRQRLEHQDGKEFRLRFFSRALDNRLHRGVIVISTVGGARFRLAFDITADNRWPSPFWEEPGRLLDY